MTRPTIFIENDKDLREHVAQQIATYGNACDLNHLDVSEVKIFDEAFQESPFVGDISQWNVNNAVSMRRMFKNAMFNGNISTWNISNAKHLTHMFYGSAFKGDLSHFRIRVDAFYAPIVHAQFEGRVPRVLYDNPHESYPAMFKEKNDFIQYAARMPFYGMHADLLLVDAANCPWASPRITEWAKDHQEIGNALGLDYETVRSLMLTAYSQLNSSQAIITLPVDFQQPS